MNFQLPAHFVSFVQNPILVVSLGVTDVPRTENSDVVQVKSGEAR